VTSVSFFITRHTTVLLVLVISRSGVRNEIKTSSFFMHYDFLPGGPDDSATLEISVFCVRNKIKLTSISIKSQKMSNF